MNKLNKVQEKRFVEKFGIYFADAPSRIIFDNKNNRVYEGNLKEVGEELKQHLADELARQRKKLKGHESVNPY